MMWEQIREVMTNDCYFSLVDYQAWEWMRQDMQYKEKAVISRIGLMGVGQGFPLEYIKHAHAERKVSVTCKANVKFISGAVFVKASWLQGLRHATLNSRLLEELEDLRQAGRNNAPDSKRFQGDRGKVKRFSRDQRQANVIRSKWRRRRNKLFLKVPLGQLYPPCATC